MRVPDFRKIVKFGPAFYKRLGNMTINKHIQSILKGNDVRGKPFKPYSQSYAKRKGVGVNDVNLKLTGKMLQSIKLTKVLVNGFRYAIKGRKINNIKMNAHISGDYGHANFKSRITSDAQDPIPEEIQFSVVDEMAREVESKIKGIIDGKVVIRV